MRLSALRDVAEVRMRVYYMGQSLAPSEFTVAPEFIRSPARWRKRLLRSIRGRAHPIQIMAGESVHVEIRRSTTTQEKP
jgi:hypothetical protein